MKRFFFHYRKSTGGMTVHYNNQCIPCKDVICKRPVETKWNERQPRLVMRGFANNVVLEDGIAYIS